MRKTMVKIKDIYDYINEIAPFDTQCGWDNSGFILGDIERPVSRAAFALDMTTGTIEEAERFSSDLLITHHPAIFHAKKTILSGDPVYKALRADLPVLSAHTCFDCADGGVNDVLAGLLELSGVEKIPSAESSEPMMRTGFLKRKMSPRDFASFVAEKLDTVVRLVDCGREIEKIALCGGSGMSLILDALDAGADAFVTGDISHHEMLEAKELGITVAAAGHFETEYAAMAELEKRISLRFPELETILIKQENPVVFISKHGS